MSDSTLLANGPLAGSPETHNAAPAEYLGWAAKAYVLGPEIPSARLDARNRPRFDNRCVNDLAAGTTGAAPTLLGVAFARARHETPPT
jgi:hypothetical protein